MLQNLRNWIDVPGNLKKLGISLLVIAVLVGAAYTVGQVQGSSGSKVDCANDKAEVANQTTNKIQDTVAKHGQIETENNRLSDPDVDSKLRAKFLRR